MLLVRLARADLAEKQGANDCKDHLMSDQSSIADMVEVWKLSRQQMCNADSLKIILVRGVDATGEGWTDGTDKRPRY